MDKLLHIQNNEKVKRADIPHLSFTDLRQQLLACAAAGGQVVHFFAYEEQATCKLLAVMRTDRLYVGGCDAPDSFASLTAESEKFHMFEREIGEQYGLKAEGHPWYKMVRY
nr:hydrogenase [Deltaproteobacteria bacterium]